MPQITEFSPRILKDRHRLSSQQINALFGEKVIEESYEEKAQTLGMVAEFLRVTDALSVAGINFIPLKGPLLSYRLYGDATTRHSHDLDILVEPSDVGRGADALQKVGYQPFGISWPPERRIQEKILKYNHHISFIHPLNQQIIELHWKLINNPWFRFMDASHIVKNNICLFDFAERSFTVLNNEMELFYLVIHGGIHRWGRLKWLADIREYLNTRKIDWDRFDLISDTFGAGRLVALCNSIMGEYMPGGELLPCHSVAPGYMIKSSVKSISDQEYKGPESVKEIIIRLRYPLLAYDGLRYKLRLIFSVIKNSLFSGRASRLFG